MIIKFIYCLFNFALLAFSGNAMIKSDPIVDNQGVTEKLTEIKMDSYGVFCGLVENVNETVNILFKLSEKICMLIEKVDLKEEDFIEMKKIKIQLNELVNKYNSLNQEVYNIGQGIDKINQKINESLLFSSGDSLAYIQCMNMYIEMMWLHVLGLNSNTCKKVNQLYILYDEINKKLTINNN